MSEFQDLSGQSIVRAGMDKRLYLSSGCGIWALIDIILIASRKVTDSDGRPLV